MNLEIKTVSGRLLCVDKEQNLTEGFDTSVALLEYLKLYFEKIQYNEDLEKFREEQKEKEEAIQLNLFLEKRKAERQNK